MSLRVWLLSDGQPGHDSLSNGIVAALQRRQPVEVHRIDLRLRFGLARNLMRGLLNRGVSLSPALLAIFYAMNELPQTGCDLIVSAGGRTSFASAWLARRLAVPNIYYGSLRRLDAALFTQVLTVEPLHPPAPNNLVLTLPPSAVDAQGVLIEGAELRHRLGLGGEPLWCMLLGGDGAGYAYAATDWQQLAQAMNRLSAHNAVRWLLLGSRRTGAVARRVLQELLRPEALACCAWYGEAQAPGVAACLGAAERVFVTEDSMTMLTEAIHAGRPPLSLQPKRVASTARYENMLAGFAARHWLKRVPISELAGVTDWSAETLGGSPLDELAEQLYARLPV
jgi:mitochondrial fission protein ELM1